MGDSATSAAALVALRLKKPLVTDPDIVCDMLKSMLSALLHMCIGQVMLSLVLVHCLISQQRLLSVSQSWESIVLLQSNSLKPLLRLR